MKEQVITPRAGRGGGAAGRGRAGDAAAQRPARRERGSSAASAGKKAGRSKVGAYLPLAAKITLGLVAVVLLLAGYRAVASASFFQARNIDVSGTSTRSGADEVRNIVKRNVAQTGVWRADLSAISNDLKELSWVRDAVVSRVLPDGLRVRVAERQALAMIRTDGGQFLWVDDDAVVTGPASPADQIIMRGWDEEKSEAARAMNRERVKMFLEMTRAWEEKGVSRRISEVNVGDPSDVRVQLTGADSQIEVLIGGEDYTNRLVAALSTLDSNRETPIGPFILNINVSQGIEAGNAVIGYSPEAPKTDVDATRAEGGPKLEVTSRAPKASPPAEARKPSREKVTPRREEEQPRRKEEARKGPEKKEKEKKTKPPAEAKSESRPRRVG